MSACLAQPPVRTPGAPPPPPSRTSSVPARARSRAPGRTPGPAPHWRRSTYSTGANNCVESAPAGADGLAVRDSKDVRLPHLVFSAAAWTSFIAALDEERPAV
ncbi:DUF397 domain-containing protein [Streptomyces sp. NRRL F-5135]|uniref:DUF397 domain-containing protein n=1 Tax=Streptomyces sp. NRRL F-5135 TaxID=1463858 RepID=UPI00099BAE51